MMAPRPLSDLAGIDRGEAIVRALRYAYDRSQHYRRRFEDVGAVPEDIRSDDDLARLPIMLDKATERELVEQSRQRDGHPFGEHLCAPVAEVVGVCTTSGTTGEPTFYPFTGNDISVMDALWAEAFRFGGVRPGDTVLHAFGLSMFLAGVPVVRALERMGARPVPVGAEAGSEKLMRLARLLPPSALCCTPSYAEHLIDRYDTESLGIKRVFCAGEPGAGLPEVRNRISDGFGGAEVIDMMGGGKGMMAVSCPANSGMHVLAPERSAVHLADVSTGERLEIRDGAVGVRVMTTLSWEAAPWVRATIGDVTEMFVSRCGCGREGMRFRVVGRVDDMLIVKGVKVYPAAVQDLVEGMAPRLTGQFQIRLDGPPPKVEPPLRIAVEVAEDTGPEALDELAALMHSRLSVRPELIPLAPGTLPRSTHKSQRIAIAGKEPQ
jgi:phenylacetate-CoA ligase